MMNLWIALCKYGRERNSKLTSIETNLRNYVCMMQFSTSESDTRAGNTNDKEENQRTEVIFLDNFGLKLMVANSKTRLNITIENKKC